MSAHDRWEKLHQNRSGPLDRARDASKLTIPSIMPPEGHDESSRLDQPYQSLGARGVNNLASKLLLALFPPSQPFFRLSMTAAAKAVAQASGVDQAQIEEDLRRVEQAVLRGFERSNLRSVLHTAIKHLAVTGNGLVYFPRSGAARFYALDRYVVQRDPGGRLIEIVVKEPVSPASLPQNLQELLNKESTADPSDRKDVDLYTHVEVRDGKHFWYQELNRIRVPDSEGSAPVEESPWITLRWTAVANEDYGRGMVEEYLGDLISLDGLNKAVLQFAAGAAKMLFMARPNGTVKVKDLEKESGSVIQGDPDDVSVLQLDKFADFQVAKGLLDDISLRLSHAFLLQSGTVRDAERVTAVEIQAMAQELEDVLGGVYTVQSQELQLPLVRRLMRVAIENGEIPPLPEDEVEPVVITGFDALGRGHELNKLRAYFQDVISTFGQQALEFIKTDVGMEMFATQHNVDVADLLRTLEEVQQGRTQQQAQALAEKAAGPVAGAVASGMSQQA